MSNYINKSYAIRKIVLYLLAAVMLLSLLPFPVSADSEPVHFLDVRPEHWAYDYIERAYADGAMEGMSGVPENGTAIFLPDMKMTSGQFVAMLVKAFYQGELKKTVSPDDTAWYAPYMTVASDRGLLANTLEDFMKGGDSPINRYYMSIILIRLVTDKASISLSQEDINAAKKEIADWNQIEEDDVWRYYTYYIAAAYALDLLKGIDDEGTFAGFDSMTRATAAVVYSRIADYVTAKQTENQFNIVFEGDWDAITAPGYKEAIEKEFYTVYPRLWARWGYARVPKTIHVHALSKDELENKSAAAYASLTYDPVLGYLIPHVAISIDFANQYPEHHVLSHELTHVVQSYVNITSSWWVENMAGYGRFRYCCWADDGSMDDFDFHVATDESLYTWSYEADDNCHWFFAYMDDHYPTSEDGYGLIDSIHLAIRRGTLTSDAGADQADSAINAIVRDVTGFETIEQLRQQYKEDLETGSWTFDGFAGYADNSITEDLPNVPNPTYPTTATVTR